MVEASTSTPDRAAIQAELLQLAQTHLDNFENYPRIHEEADKEYYVHLLKGEGGSTSTTVSKYRADGLGVKHFEWLTANNIKMAGKVNDIITPTELEIEEGGHQIMYIHIKTPMIMSNRSQILCRYIIKSEDGSEFTVISSNKGNEELRKKYAAKIGKDVLASTDINYLHTKAFKKDDGTEGVYLTQISRTDPNGSIPDMFKNKMVEKQKKGLGKLVETVRANYDGQ